MIVHCFYNNMFLRRKLLVQPTAERAGWHRAWTWGGGHWEACQKLPTTETFDLRQIASALFPHLQFGNNNSNVTIFLRKKIKNNIYKSLGTSKKSICSDHYNNFNNAVWLATILLSPPPSFHYLELKYIHFFLSPVSN